MNSYLRPEGDVSPVEQRAAITALSGGLRVPFGRTRPFFFSGNFPPTEIAQNRSSGVLLEEIRRSDPDPASFLLGQNSSLSPPVQVIFLAQLPLRFVLYPGDSLWMRVNFTTTGSTAITVTEVRI